MKDVSREQAVKTLLEGNNDGALLLSMDREAVNRIVGEICKALIGNGLSFAQVEMLLELAKGRLYRMHI